MPLFPLKRYLGDKDHLEIDESPTNKKLQELLTKVKHRSELQQKDGTSITNESSKNSHFKEDGNKAGRKRKKNDDSDNRPNKKIEEDEPNNLLVDMEKLSVEDGDKNNPTDINSNTLNEEVAGGVENNGKFTIIGDIKFKKKIKVKRFLPDWLANPSVVPADLKNLEVSINDIPELHSVFIKTLKKNNISHFFPVQAQVIPWLLRMERHTSLLPAGDICVSAPTGSGKTLAYAIPILQGLMGRRVGQIQALIVLPVQDLAIQVTSVLKAYSANTGLKVHLSSGALSLSEDRDQLLRHRMCVGWESLVDVLVATPGRLVEHLYTTPGFSLKYLRYIVIDEADRVIDSHQNNWLHHLDLHLDTQSIPLLTVQNMRSATRRPQKLLFSATLSSDPEKLNQLHLFQPRLFTSVVETTKGEGEFIGQLSTPAELRQCMVRCVLAAKPLVLYQLLTRPDWTHVLVFVSSSRSGHQLKALLTLLSQHMQHTFKVAEISAECSPKHRESLLADFASGKIDVLISTDQLARGMDIPGVQYVVSYDMPKYVKAYIHRVGRTGRAGHEGSAVTLVTHSQIGMFNQMLQNTGILENIKELNVEEEDLKVLEEPFRESLRQLKTANEKEEVKNVNKMKLTKRGCSIKISSKRKRKKDISRNVKRVK